MVNDLLKYQQRIVTDEMDISLYHLSPSDWIPNSDKPVILFKSMYSRVAEDLSQIILEDFRQFGWTNNWRDIVDDKCHYHSNTHEVLGLGKGKCNLVLGRENGLDLSISEGDIILIPSGVSHFSYSLRNYEMVGGYPHGEKWDMIYDKKVEVTACYPQRGIYSSFFDLNEYWENAANNAPPSTGPDFY